MDIQKPTKHSEILALWPSLPVVSRDLGFNYVAVWKWADREYIPPEWWAALVECAHLRDLEVTYKLLAETVRNKKPMNKSIEKVA